VLKQRTKVDRLDFFQKCIIGFEKFFLFWVPMNILKDRKAKLESAYSFMLKYGGIQQLRGPNFVIFCPPPPAWTVFIP
jgi:hypothetical protein